jgi:cbb3-type cytochrome oxidase subunit 3
MFWLVLIFQIALVALLVFAFRAGMRGEDGES